MGCECTIYKAADLVGKRWTLIILLELYKGENEWTRYKDIKGNINTISPRVLSMRLKELEEEGFIEKSVDASQFPVKSEYRLTQCGKDFIPVIKELKIWALKWKILNNVCERSECLHCKN